jgi:hypothetical protein
MLALRPNLVVANLKDESVLRAAMASDPSMADVPLISVTPDIADPVILVEAVRRVLRKRGGAGV